VSPDYERVLDYDLGAAIRVEFTTERSAVTNGTGEQRYSW